MKNVLLRVVLSVCVCGWFAAGNVSAQKSEQRKAEKPEAAGQQAPKNVQDEKKRPSDRIGQPSGTQKDNRIDDPAPTAADRQERIVQENNKHLRRMAQIDRLASVGQKKKNDQLAKKAEKLRSLENKRYERRLAKLGKPQSGDKPAKTKAITKEQASKEAEAISESTAESTADQMIKTVTAEGN